MKSLIIAVVLLFATSKVFGQEITFSLADTALSSDALSEWKPDSLERYESVPKIYQQWWEEICECSGLNGKFDRIVWWRIITPNAENEYLRTYAFRCPIVGYCRGWWDVNHHMYIASARVLDERLVKHEMLHDLLGSSNVKSPKHHKLFEKCKVL